jgi:hypothetical protein
MIVVIDPEIKKLFFDRIMEMNGNSPYDTLKWIESVAFGEKTILAKQEQELDGYINKIERLENQVDRWRRDYINEKKVRQKMQRKVRGVDDELESYLDEIQGYRSVLINSGLGEYVE